jgi:hypothetical protein
MKPVKLALKFAIVTLSLATLHAMQTPSHQQNNWCPPFARFCSTDTSTGSCGFRLGEDCTTCYGDDGSIVVHGCPPPDGFPTGLTRNKK